MTSSLLERAFYVKRLKQSVKQMLNGFAYQDAGDYLTEKQKREALGIIDEMASAADAKATVSSETPLQRVALLSDGQDTGGALQFAIDTCKRQPATLDILHLGLDAPTSLVKAMTDAGIRYEFIALGNGETGILTDYFNTRRGLIYVVATSDDAMGMKSGKQAPLHGDAPLPVPMVMVAG